MRSRVTTAAIGPEAVLALDAHVLSFVGVARYWYVGARLGFEAAQSNVPTAIAAVNMKP